MTKSTTKTESVVFGEASVYAALSTSGQSLVENDAFFALTDALRQVARRKELTRSAMGSLVERMQRSMQYLDANWSINSLGEVQSMGLEVDRACAVYSAAIEEYARLRYLVVRIGAVSQETVDAFEAAAGWNQDNR